MPPPRRQKKANTEQASYERYLTLMDRHQHSLKKIEGEEALPSIFYYITFSVWFVHAAGGTAPQQSKRWATSSYHSTNIRPFFLFVSFLINRGDAGAFWSLAIHNTTFQRISSSFFFVCVDMLTAHLDLPPVPLQANCISWPYNKNERTSAQFNDWLLCVVVDVDCFYKQKQEIEKGSALMPPIDRLCCKVHLIFFLFYVIV